MTVESAPRLRYTPEQFIDAHDDGAFGSRRRVQLIDGEVWELGPIQGWHGVTVPRVLGLLRAPGAVVTTQTLPMPDSMPDPDAWVLRTGAEATGLIRGYSTWDPSDILLVVEVSDTTRAADLGPKARMYANGGVAHYWVVTKDRLHAFSEPQQDGYQTMTSFGGGLVQLPYADVSIDVAELFEV